MISAAIAGLGRWGRSVVESVHGKSQRIGFVRAIDTEPVQARRFAATVRAIQTGDTVQADGT